MASNIEKELYDLVHESIDRGNPGYRHESRNHQGGFQCWVNYRLWNSHIQSVG